MLLKIISNFKIKNKYVWYGDDIRENNYIINIFIKYCAAIIIFLILIFFKHIYIKNQKIKLDLYQKSKN